MKHIQKLEAIKTAIDGRIELHDKIVNAGTPPHSDFWCQSVHVADEAVINAISKLVNIETCNKRSRNRRKRGLK